MLISVSSYRFLFFHYRSSVRTDTVVSTKVVLEKRKSKRDDVERYYRQRWLYSCLIEAQGVSALEKETAKTRVLMPSPSFLLDAVNPVLSSTKLLLPIIPLGIVACTFTLL